MHIMMGREQPTAHRWMTQMTADDAEALDWLRMDDVWMTQMTADDTEALDWLRMVSGGRQYDGLETGL